jgi:hypothetical protein
MSEFITSLYLEVRKVEFGVPPLRICLFICLQTFKRSRNCTHGFNGVFLLHVGRGNGMYSRGPFTLYGVIISLTQNGISVRLLILKSILNRELNIYLDHITELI